MSNLSYGALVFLNSYAETQKSYETPLLKTITSADDVPPLTEAQLRRFSLDILKWMGGMFLMIASAVGVIGLGLHLIFG